MPVSFLIKLLAEACNFIKKETLAQVFFYEFCEICKNTFFKEHLRTTASKIWQEKVYNKVILSKYKTIIWNLHVSKKITSIFFIEYLEKLMFWKLSKITSKSVYSVASLKQLELSHRYDL